MKQVLLTESQFKALLNEERLTLILQEAVEESTSYDKLRLKIKNLLLAGVSAISIFACITNLKIPNSVKESLKNMVRTEQAKGEEGKKEAQLDTTGFSQKVKDVEAYMKKALANQGYSLNSTGLKPETLVWSSMKHNFDLPFLMAAAHQESCFGATPRARRTNSVFSVGSYDNGKNTVTYDDPNDSVEDYIRLLNNNYLVDGKTLDDLMQPGSFVNGAGNRYASDKNYEGKIKGIRNRIIKSFPDLA